MNTPSPQNPFHNLTDDVRVEVRGIVEQARHAALASLSPETGYPMCTRINFATQDNGVPFTFISALSAHTLALRADSRCSLLIGKIGKGDALAHPRLTIFCDAALVDPADEATSQMRTMYLADHPKAALYIDLPDFRFFRLNPIQALFNGGFGRAYKLTAADLTLK